MGYININSLDIENFIDYKQRELEMKEMEDWEYEAELREKDLWQERQIYEEMRREY